MAAVMKVWRHELSPVILVGLRDGLETVHSSPCRFDVMESAAEEEVYGYVKCFAIDSFCGRDIVNFFGCCSQAEYYPRKLGGPIVGFTSGHQGGLEGAVKSFDDPVGFRVVGRLGVELDAEAGCERRPEVGGEDGTSVGCNDIWEAEFGDPTVEEGLEAVFRCCTLHRRCFGPSGRTVDDREEVSASA